MVPLIKIDKQEIDKQLNVVLDWVKDRIENNDIVRFSDIVDYAHRVLQFHQLSKKKIIQAVRLMPNYLMSSSQARKRLRSDRNRPVTISSLGALHCDLAYYSVSKDFSTGVSFRNGYLIGVDTLSRFIFTVILHKDRKADSIIKAFKVMFREFQKQYPKQRITTVGFDRETSVMSNKVQDFFKEKKIKFYPFHNSSSKSKFAENGIKRIRNSMVRMKQNPKKWWQLIQLTVDSLNAKPIRINNQFLKMENGNYYAPKDVSIDNIEHFKTQLQNADAGYFYSQFEVDSRFVHFNFKIDDFVRAKLIVTSAEVLGKKRSEITLGEEVFVIKKPIAYISRRNTIEKAYVCLGLTLGRTETFEESDIALTNNPNIYQ